MKRKSCRATLQRGSALISALAVVAMTSLLMSGVCILSTSHAARQRHEADYALAMQLAEAGVNYEINYYSVNSASHVGTANAYTGSVPGISGTFTVYSDATQPTLLTAVGTVGTGNYAISRKIQVTVAGSSVFNGNYTVFGTTGVTVNNNVVSGAVASNNAVSGSVSSSSSCHVSSHCSDNYDTVDTICNKQFSNGWNTLSSSTNVNNQCAHMRCLQSSYFPYWNMTTTCNWTSTGSATTCTDTQCSKLPSSILILTPCDRGSQSMVAGGFTPAFQAASTGFQSMTSTPFTGDYYFTTCQLKNCTLYCDSNCNSTSAADCPDIVPGPIKIWCGGSDNTDDQLCSNFHCTSTTKSCQPRCYYGKAHTCTFTQTSDSISGNTCGLYAVKCGKSGSTTHSKVVCDGCKSLKGTIIGDDVQVNSNSFTSTSTSASNANISHPTDPSQAGGYGFNGGWKELVANSGAVFTDGTNN